ncbi:ABC transporter ATP-binding protein [Bacillus sp. NEAU-CP5]|uniref:ABC transporter ATP-binding protein n=1 Tax=Bacillus TaxID=1386 RepID=UPI00046E94C2|nr:MULTISPECIES: ABC transporter ATP-binding protein [Bacillus]ASP24898.1 ABC transporter ATP-binding protein [Bacillus velezensis]ATO09647.1 ABC transporter ATP-binding protein [Bacillus velezensis]AWK44824.1 ABC transporter ATP-binding protein [Bacillus velezensis]MBE7960136.1 ABC transporter ATP-binding protein [Bacillus amyloliquefaciens]MBG9464377.1 multidrug ABC transporter ATP-binding protein [Bacillus amyloliquefaciens]
MSNLLEIRNISKSFGHKAVLKDVTFNVPAGSIVGFIGDNGAGKSTTFKTILGLISQDRGKVKIFGKENLDKHIKFKEDIGVVFDAMNLPAHLTIKQLNHVFKKLFDAWDQDHFYRLVHSFSLPMDKKVNTFSRGMSMKLSVAVALSHNAKLLLLDEATGGLDPSSRDDLLNELKSFVSKSNGGILLSSHIMTDVEKIASHIIIMKDGEILLNEEKDKVLESYTVIDVDEGQLAELDEDIVLAKRKHGSYWSVLVSDQQKLPNGVTANTISIEEISVFLTRSENIERSVTD